MGMYLDPKTELTFRKVFGQRPHLLVSFLNAMLPLAEDEQIESLEYLTAEMVPDNPDKKNSIVDVRCQDQKGRQFIVEMQLIWTKNFKQRVLFNMPKAYVRQLDRKEDFNLLEPVYSLNLVNDEIETDMPDTFYHHYQLVHSADSHKVIDGFQLVFVELPKFKPQTIADKKMQVLWLRFLTEIDERTHDVDGGMTTDPHLTEALDILKESAYSDSELLAYEKFWDSVRRERTMLTDAEARGFTKGAKETNINNAKAMKALGMSAKDITTVTGLNEDEIARL